MRSTITFCGGAGLVTGSNFLFDIGEAKFLIDCGLTQGTLETEALNWEPFPYKPEDISFLIVTHAHIDHIGRIPKLVHDGFRGKILSTEPTKAIAEPLLFDALELLFHSAKRQGKEPFYGKEDITKALQMWETVPLHTKQALRGGVSFEFFRSGHILGSSMACFTRDGRSIVFTGDLGSGNSPLLPLVEDLPAVQYLVMESVYGDRVRHEDGNSCQELENIIENTVRRGGTLLIPAFSTERTQDLLFDIRTLMLKKQIPSMPVYLDSPLAQKITTAYLSYPSYFAPNIEKRIEKGENIFTFPELRWIEDMEQSRALMQAPNPKIIIAGSGMSNGGRVISHEEHILPDPASTLLIVGYQAAGSLGRRLIDGAKKVEIMGRSVPVKCQIEHIYGYSAHMDGEALLEFVNKGNASLKEVFVVMGEPASSAFLAQRIRDYLGVKAVTPERGEKVTIEV